MNFQKMSWLMKMIISLSQKNRDNGTLLELFKKVFAFTKSNNIKAFLVGGAVRDYLLSLFPTDIDMAYSSSFIPKNAFDINKRYWTFKMNFSDAVLNFARIRKDIKCLGRQAFVDFNATLLDDARRRDFTINAIYMDENLEIVNPLNVTNLDKIEFIGDPETRVREDYFRLWRYFRFFSKYSKESAPIKINFDKNVRHSSVLVKKELFQILESKRVNDVVPAMKDLLMHHFMSEPLTDNFSLDDFVYKKIYLMYPDIRTLSKCLSLSTYEKIMIKEVNRL